MKSDSRPTCSHLSASDAFHAHTCKEYNDLFLND